MSNPKVFISYSHDSEDHREWVRLFATKLREHGVDAMLDAWDLTPGQDVAAFMQHGIADAERVVMICSENYVIKAEAGQGGVGYERLIVTTEVTANIDTKKFLPVVRNNPSKNKIPNFLGPRLYIDFSDDAKRAERMEELVNDLHGLLKYEKPPLGVFAAAKFSAPPPAKAVVASAAKSLDADWFTQQAVKADAGLKALGFTAAMEVRACIEGPLAESQKALLAAVEASKIRTFGWPIGITLNQEEWQAKPFAAGIGAEVSIQREGSRIGHASYDLWAASTAGDFYTKLNLFEDDRDEDAIFFNSRIVRVTESLMFLNGFYQNLAVDPGIVLNYRCTHDGLAGRVLKSSNPIRYFTGGKSNEAASSTEITVPVGEIMDQLPRLTQRICAPMFMLFHFAEFQDKIYDDIVTRFVNGEAS